MTRTPSGRPAGGGGRAVTDPREKLATRILDAFYHSQPRGYGPYIDCTDLTRTKIDGVVDMNAVADSSPGNICSSRVQNS